MKLILTIALWGVSPNLWIRKLRHRGSVSQQMVGLYFKLKYVWPESSYSWPFSHLVFLVLSKCVHLLSRLTGHLRHCGSCVCEAGGSHSEEHGNSPNCLSTALPIWELRILYSLVERNGKSGKRTWPSAYYGLGVWISGSDGLNGAVSTGRWDVWSPEKPGSCLRPIRLIGENRGCPTSSSLGGYPCTTHSALWKRAALGKFNTTYSRDIFQIYNIDNLGKYTVGKFDKS